MTFDPNFKVMSFLKSSLNTVVCLRDRKSYPFYQMAPVSMTLRDL